MTEKRFELIVDLDKGGVCHIQDTAQDILTFYNDLTYNMGSAKEICDLLNELVTNCHSLEEENMQLKKELHLMHIRTMFSTVQSFKGDVSKRYKYSKETDRIYDTANHYGQYDKILDKKEITMLLNEYETILKELQE